MDGAYILLTDAVLNVFDNFLSSLNTNEVPEKLYHGRDKKNLKQHVMKKQRSTYKSYIEKMILNILLNDPDQNNSIQSKPKRLLSYIKSLHTDKTGVTQMRIDVQITADTKQKFNILNKQFQSEFPVEPQDNIPDCTKTNTLKTRLPIFLPGVLKLLHNINTHKTCDLDNISGRILKELREQTTPVLILILFFKRTLNTHTRNIT